MSSGRGFPTAGAGEVNKCFGAKVIGDAFSGSPEGVREVASIGMDLIVLAFVAAKQRVEVANGLSNWDSINNGEKGRGRGSINGCAFVIPDLNSHTFLHALRIAGLL